MPFSSDIGDSKPKNSMLKQWSMASYEEEDSGPWLTKSINLHNSHSVEEQNKELYSQI